MPAKAIRVGFVGAGYIASWHADVLSQVPGVKLVAVCDPASVAAKALADQHGATAYSSLAEMLTAGACDALHVLTPPQLHRQHALQGLAGGAHVLVEKPFAVSLDDSRAVIDAAAKAGRLAAVNHNFLGLPSYQRLKRLIADGVLGRIDSSDICWRFPLTPLRSGPFSLWMLRSPQNILLEIGPHLYAFAIDLFGPLEDITLRVGKPITIPGGLVHYQNWRISARAGHVDISMSLSLVEGIDDRSVSLRGVSGAARLDFASDTLVVSRPNTADIVVNPLLHELSQAGQHVREGMTNAFHQLASLNRRSPYALGFRGAIGAFYDAIAKGETIERRFSGESAAAVIRAIEETLQLLPRRALAMPAPQIPAPVPVAADTLVIGGTGFIGRYLTRGLVSAGHRVRVLSRASASPFADLGDRVDIVPVSLHDGEGMRAAMKGIDTVYHLARAVEATWEGYLQNDVAVTRVIGEAAVDAGVRLFVYTGTIASYDASKPDRPITEETGFGPHSEMDRRNFYARSKALCEEILLEMQEAQGLPLVIARPGVVVGAGGPLQHWGIGRWHGAGAVRIWGDGSNILPFVLVEDVADALTGMAGMATLAGQSFNLVGDPLLSANDYFEAIRELTGTQIKVVKGSLTTFYLTDLVKYSLKRHVLGRRDLKRPSRIDWVSRGHLSPFVNTHAKQVLGWRPESDRKRFIERMIDGTALFGF